MPTVAPPECATIWKKRGSPSVMVDRITGRFDQIGVENVESIASRVGSCRARPISRLRSSG
ncbi:MAG: hypothetical protein VB124_02670 [Burkholderia sp.]